MESKFGGVPLEEEAKSKFQQGEEKPKSKFGGVAVSGANIDVNAQNYAALQNAVTIDTPDEIARAAVEESDVQRQQMIDLAYKRFPQDVVDSWKDSPIGFGEADDFYDWSQVLPGGGLVQGAKSLKLLNISQKIEEGLEINPGEQEMLDEFIDRQIEMSVRGMTYGGKFRYYGSQMPAFMLEFAATGGIGKAAQAGTLKATQEFAKRSALSATVAKTTGRVARVMAQSSAMIPMTAAKYGELRLGPWNVTDRGQIIFSEAKESPAMSALKAFAYTNAEVASELSGAKINKYIIDPVAKRLKGPLSSGLRLLPDKLKDGLFSAYQKIKPNATISNAFSAAGWNGMLSELGEERVADILRETINLALEDGYTFEDVLSGIVPSVDQLLLEAGLIGTLGGIRSVGSAAMNILIDKGFTQDQAQEITDNMTTNELEQFVENELAPITEEEALARELAEKETLVESIAEEIKTGKQKIRQQTLNAYDEFQQGITNSLIEARNKVIRLLEKTRNKLAKQSPRLGRRIAANGGINIQSISEEGGFDLADLRDVNRALGTTVFRSEGGMSFDEVARQMENEIPYLDQRRNELGEVDVSVVFDLVNELIADPKLALFPEIDLEIDLINQEIEKQSDMSEIELQEYYAKVEQESDPTSELREIETTPISELEDLIDNFYPTVSSSEFEESVQGVDDYIDSLEYPDFPIIDETIQRQAEADLMGEPQEIAPDQSIFREGYYRWFDSLGALKDLSIEAARRGFRTPVGRNLGILYRMYAGVAGMASQMISNKTFRINASGNIVVTGKGLKSILNDFDNLIMQQEPNKKVREKELKEYLIARRYLNDLRDNADVQVTEEQLLASARVLDELAIKYGDSLIWFDKTAKEIYEYQQRVMQLLVSSGVMSQETYDSIMQNHQNYIPFQRVLDAEFGEYGVKTEGKLFTSATLNRVVKKIVGSERQVKDPIQSIIKNTFRVVDLAWQNRVAESIGAMADVMPEYIEPMKVPMDKVVLDDGQVTYRPSKIAPKDAIIVMKDGKRKFYRVHPAIMKAIQQMQPEQLGFVSKLLQAPASVLRAGATLIPEFWIRNILRDQHSAFIQSGARPIPIYDPVLGLVSLMGKGELHQKWMQSGGSFNSYMEPNDNGMAKAMNELLGNQSKVVKYLKNPLMLPNDISLSLEQSVRIGVFNAAKRQGKTDLEAAFEARDATLDFSRGGTASKIINKYVPFFNAGMQGLDKLARALKQNPKATIMWASATITFPSIMIAGYYLYGAPEDERKEYLEIPQWQKDMFWVFKYNGEWMRYPKPFTIGYMFGSVPERFMNWMASENIKEGQEFWLELLKGVAGSISPVYDPSAIVPPLFKVWLEGTSNYNFFKGQNIYSPFLNDLPPEERKQKYTSDTAAELGKIFNVSPAIIDNTLRGLIAGSADYVTDASDFLIKQVREWNGEAIPEKPSAIADIPVVRAFAMRFPTGSGAMSVQTFYDLSQEARQIDNKMQDLRGDERQEYRDKNLVMSKTIPYIKSSTKVIRELNRRRNAIYENLVMTSDEKAEELRRIDDMILDRARKTIERFSENMKLHEEGNL